MEISGLTLVIAFLVSCFSVFLQFCDGMEKFLSVFPPSLPPLTIQSQFLLYVIKRTVATLSSVCCPWNTKKHSIFALQEKKNFFPGDTAIEIFL